MADSVENGDEILNRTFGSYNRTNYQPSLTVNYTEPDTQFFPNDTYYINSKETGKYLQINTSGAINGVSGLLNSLGNRVQWQVQKVQEGYVIRSVMDPTKYLSGSASLSDDSVNIISVSNTAIPNTCLWAINAANGTGCLIRNMSNDRYLCSNGTSVYTSYNIGTYESTTYKNFVWRMASTSYYGNSSAYSAKELESGYAIEDVVVKVGESKTPYVTLRPHNAIWADASDFVFSISAGEENGISIIQPQNSVFGQKVGSVLCTAMHKVTGTTDAFVVYTQPLLIFQAKETYDGDENVDTAEDLLYGDMDENDLRELDWINRTHFLGQTSEWYEAEWRGAVATFYAKDELLDVANDMIDHFMDGTGTSYSDSTLTNKVVTGCVAINQEDTQQNMGPIKLFYVSNYRYIFRYYC